MTRKMYRFELGIFSFNSYIYNWTLGFTSSTRAFDLLARAFNLATRTFNVLTRAFELVTCRSEPITRGFELVTRGFELITRALLFLTRNLILPEINSFISTEFWLFIGILSKLELFLKYASSQIFSYNIWSHLSFFSPWDIFTYQLNFSLFWPLDLLLFSILFPSFWLFFVYFGCYEFCLSCITYDHGHNIFGLFDVSPNFPFARSETKRVY